MNTPPIIKSPYENDACKYCALRFVSADDKIERCNIHTRGMHFAECKKVKECRYFLPNKEKF